MDLTVRTEATSFEDRSWLGSAHGTDSTQTITLDISSFTAATHFPTGILRSGTVLGKITASGLYGPYDNAASDGRETAAGLLFNSIKIGRPGVANTGPDHGAPILLHGQVREALLPTNHGLDAGARTDLAGRIIFR